MSRPITLVLPAFNEEAALPELLETTDRAMRAAAVAYRVLVVDDGSTDGTAREALRMGRTLPVTLVRHDVNRGLGAALRTGLLSAIRDSDVIVTMDADNSHDPALIPSLLADLSSGADVVIASRFRRGAVATGIPLHRRVLSVGASLAMRACCGVPGVRDYSSGYRAYSAPGIRRTIARFGDREFIRQSGFACMVELLLKMTAAGCRVTEHPIVLRYGDKRSASKMRVLRTVRGYVEVVRCHRARSGRSGLVRVEASQGEILS